MQNSVDACRQRQLLEGIDYKGEINILFYEKESKYFFQIEDNGIGMSIEVLKHYFLEVGSSFRKSSFWKKECSDSEGNSLIERSGKFGMGVLAAFLIGNKINIQTKSSTSQFGYPFETDLNSDQIEVTKIHRDKVGTSIIIPVNEEIFELLMESEYQFDKWYTHASPKVTYIDHTGKLDKIGGLGYHTYSPGFGDVYSPHWQEIQDKNFNKILDI